MTATRVGQRNICAGKAGSDNVILEVDTHRVKCHDCGCYRMEELPFLPSQKSRITRSLERTILELRSEMSITAVANHFDLDWRCVKEVEKRSLARKYANVPLKDVEVIGIDEIHIGKRGYKTVVRDLRSGAVLHVADGRGSESLEVFSKKIKRSKASINAVAMDMSTAYIKWAGENLPDAKIVFDHFHVIKLMNDKLNQIRRETVKKLEAEDADQQVLKKKVPASKKRGGS